MQAAIRRLGLAARDTRKPRALIGEEMLLRTAERFARGIGPDGKPWKRSRRADRSGGQTLNDSGVLASRTAYDVKGTDDLDLFSWDKRARVHQLGLPITPTDGHEFLTIPLRARGGSYEAPERAVAPRKGRDGRRARDYGARSTFIARVRGRLFIFQKLGDGAVRALFLLVRSVVMPARPFLGFSDDDLAMALRIFADFLGDSFLKES